LYGQVITDENCPTVAGPWALAQETAMKCATAKQRSATNRTFNRSEEHEQGFSERSRGSDFQPIIGIYSTAKPSKAETDDLHGGCQVLFFNNSLFFFSIINCYMIVSSIISVDLVAGNPGS
jgi:hypothetical protein